MSGLRTNEPLLSGHGFHVGGSPSVPGHPDYDDGEPWRCADPVELRRWAVDRDRRIALRGDVWADEG